MNICNLGGVVLACLLHVAGVNADDTALPRGSTASTLEADLAWRQLDAQGERLSAFFSTLSDAMEKKEISREDFFRRKEAACLAYRQEGLRFFNRFPDDPRRWRWLKKTMNLGPKYYA